MFKPNNLNIVNTNLVLNGNFEQDGEPEEALDNDSND